jgi:hypothetical protein
LSGRWRLHHPCPAQVARESREQAGNIKEIR